jgi:hypothetical protein
VKSSNTILVVLLLLGVAGCASNMDTNYYSSSDIKWGEPAQLTEYMGKNFTVSDGGGSGGYGFFPVKVPREDGSVTYRIAVQFTPDHLRMINYCEYQDHSETTVAYLSAQADAQGDQVENGYIIRHPQESKTEREGKMCGVQIGPGKYLLFRNNSSLRMYADSKNYMELVTVETAHTPKKPSIKYAKKAPSEYVNSKFKSDDEVEWFGEIVSARKITDQKTNLAVIEYLCRYYELVSDPIPVKSGKEIAERRTLKVKRTPDQYFIASFGPVKNYSDLEQRMVQQLKEQMRKTKFYAFTSGIPKNTVIFEGIKAVYVSRKTKTDPFSTSSTPFIDLEFVD